jgi:hypothetical protein
MVPNPRSPAQNHRIRIYRHLILQIRMPLIRMPAPQLRPIVAPRFSASRTSARRVIPLAHVLLMPSDLESFGPVALLTEDALHARMSAAARWTVGERPLCGEESSRDTNIMRTCWREPPADELTMPADELSWKAWSREFYV